MTESPYEIAFGPEMQLFLVIGMIVLIVCLLLFLLDEDTSPQVVVLVGLCLIAIAGGALWYIENMKIWIENLADKQLISPSFQKEFSRRSNWFAYILPFFSAAIGTNLISDALTKRLHYKKPLTAIGVVKSIPEFLNIIFGFFVLVPLLGALLPFIYLSQKVREYIPQFMDFLENFNRRLYLNLLKLDIICRSYKRKDGKASISSTSSDEAVR